MPQVHHGPCISVCTSSLRLQISSCFRQSAFMSSAVQLVFERTAAKVGVAESDFLVLKIAGIVCMSDLYARVPDPGRLETFLSKMIYPFAAYVNDGQAVRFNREDSEDHVGDLDTWLFGGMPAPSANCGKFPRLFRRRI